MRLHRACLEVASLRKTWGLCKTWEREGLRVYWALLLLEMSQGQFLFQGRVAVGLCFVNTQPCAGMVKMGEMLRWAYLSY